MAPDPGGHARSGWEHAAAVTPEGAAGLAPDRPPHLTGMGSSQDRPDHKITCTEQLLMTKSG